MIHPTTLVVNRAPHLRRVDKAGWMSSLFRGQFMSRESPFFLALGLILPGKNTADA
jgi:hypothetical protein